MPHNPDARRPRFRLLRVRSPLLTESLLLSFRPATEMFQFTGCPLPALCVQTGVTMLFTPPGYPIRRSLDHCVIAAPQSISLLTASFIGPLPPGIHRAPFVAFVSTLVEKVPCPKTRNAIWCSLTNDVHETTKQPKLLCL